MNDDPRGVTKSETEWRAELTPEEYAVLRQKATETPFSGQYVDTKTPGVYRCRACRQELFSSRDKFDSGTGWPSFTAPLAGDGIELERDLSLGMERIEVRCQHCGSHLGHVFPDGPGPTGERYCINSCALALEPTDESSQTTAS